METLEQYAQFQAESHHYDFEANLTLMKLLVNLSLARVNLSLQSGKPFLFLQNCIYQLTNHSMAVTYIILFKAT